jgi:hypothetical protein
MWCSRHRLLRLVGSINWYKLQSLRCWCTFLSYLHFIEKEQEEFPQSLPHIHLLRDHNKLNASIHFFHLKGPNCCLNVSTFHPFIRNEPQPTSMMNIRHCGQSKCVYPAELSLIIIGIHSLAGVIMYICPYSVDLI